MSSLCTICNKLYASNSSLWNHMNKKHTIKSDNVHNLVHNPVHNLVHNNVDTESDGRSNICKYCNKELCNRKSRWRHEKICKMKDISGSDINELRDTMNVMKKEIEELKSKSLESSNNIVNNGNQFNIQNNYINYVAPSEICKVYDNQIYKKITHNDYISHIYSPDKCMMLRNFTTYMYTTNNLNEHKNIYIPTITNNDIVYRFNAKSNTFIESNKVRTIDEFIRSNMACIENLVYEYNCDQYDNVLEFFEALGESTRQYNIIHNDIYIIIRNANEIVKHNFDEYIRKQNAEKAIENETKNNTLIVKKKKKTVEKREEIEEDNI